MCLLMEEERNKLQKSTQFCFRYDNNQNNAAAAYAFRVLRLSHCIVRYVFISTCSVLCISDIDIVIYILIEYTCYLLVYATNDAHKRGFIFIFTLSLFHPHVVSVSHSPAVVDSSAQKVLSCINDVWPCVARYFIYVRYVCLCICGNNSK